MVKIFLSFRFSGCPIVAVAAKPGGPEAPESENPLGISELIEVLTEEHNNMEASVLRCSKPLVPWHDIYTAKCRTPNITMSSS